MSTRKSPQEKARARERKIIRSLRPQIDYVGHGLLLLILLLTVYMYPTNWNSELREVDFKIVWYYGWITAISTGLGVVPFIFVSEPDNFWLGISNAVAGGMMIAASYSLAYEGTTCNSTLVDADPLSRTIIGFVVGVVFIVGSKELIKKFGDKIEFGDIKGADAQKIILIIFVMTLHSMTEGIGIGVSFGTSICSHSSSYTRISFHRHSHLNHYKPTGGESGKKLGQFISLSLALHNVPEGLAVALVSTSKKVSKLRAGLWAVFTSLPQPIMAIPAFLFVKTFLPLLPAGLGFASGAMAFVAAFELFPEAVEETSFSTTAIVGSIACGLMVVMQNYIKTEIH